MLGEQLRIEQGVVQAGVEDVPLLIGGTLDAERAELAVPGVLERCALALEVPPRQLQVQVAPRLLEADERGADLYLDYRPGAARGETRVGAGAGACRRAEPGVQLFAQVDTMRAEGGAELDDEIPLEVRQHHVREVRVHTIGVVAGDLARRWVDVHVTGREEAGRLDPRRWAAPSRER